MNSISLTKELIRFNTINPPGNEKSIAQYIGGLLSKHNFDVEFIDYENNRQHLIASKGIKKYNPPIVFSGHLDVVPLAQNKWDTEPLNPQIIDRKLYGRGSSDMKAGIAAFIVAAVEYFEKPEPVVGIKIILTADEEYGCDGAGQLKMSDYDIGEAGALIVAEPTSNYPFIGHKGAVYMNATTTGIAAHSSLPELGENAIYKAARAITNIENYRFNSIEDLLLGYPTINVGKINGGVNLNSVPDKTVFTIDVRTTMESKNDDIIAQLKNVLGDEVSLEPFVNLDAVTTSFNDPFVQMVYEVCGIDKENKIAQKTAPYLTDASVLKPMLNNPPTIILGPGEPSMAHKTDEYCYVDKIEDAVKIYKNIIDKYGEME